MAKATVKIFPAAVAFARRVCYTKGRKRTEGRCFRTGPYLKSDGVRPGGGRRVASVTGTLRPLAPSYALAPSPATAARPAPMAVPFGK